MGPIRALHTNLIKGKLNKLVCEDKIYSDFRWVYDFAMLRHQHYALQWGFNLEKEYPHTRLNDIALYSLLINRHDDKAKEIIDRYISDKKPIDFNTVFKWGRPEYLASASKDMCQLLLDSFPDNASINYMVTSWSVMSNYDIKDLKYAYDHNVLYKSLNKLIPERKGKYELYVLCNSPQVALTSSIVYKENFGDRILDTVDKETFDDLWNKLDLNDICDIASGMEWGRSMDYDMLIYNNTEGEEE